MPGTPPIQASDLDSILDQASFLERELKGAHVFVTGGTGFFGRWLLESFAHANQRWDLGARVTVLSRDPVSFATRAPHLASLPFVRFKKGEVTSYAFPDDQPTHVIHAAAPVNLNPTEQASASVRDPIIGGTRVTLDQAHAAGVRHFLLVSSGAVYGKQQEGVTHLPESYVGSMDPADPRSHYGLAKQEAEEMGAGYARIARCFAFLGPHLPLDGRFAIGNFIEASLRGGPIRLSGDGTPLRSYLYPTDLMVWLWTILLKGTPGQAYNVGSEHALNLQETAKQVAEVATEVTRSHQPIQVEVLGKPVPGRSPDRYIPSTQKAQQELGLRQTVDLREAVRRTLDWSLRS